MRISGLAGAKVVDATGRVLASAGRTIEGAAGDGPSAAAADSAGRAEERVPLPDGGFLVAERLTAEEPWSRIVRAFLHEARSPLNALGIYLELLQAKLGGTVAGGERAIQRAQEQVRRLEELLRVFGDLAAPTREDPVDLARVVGAVGRFAAHEATRRGLQLELRVSPSVWVRADAGALAESLVLLLGGALEASAGAELVFVLQAAGDVAELQLSGLPQDEETLLDAGAGALAGVGATLERTPGALLARFPITAQPALGAGAA